VSGFEPENLVSGGAAALGDLPQIALGTVIGSAVFMLTTGIELALLLVPMEVRIPRQGGLAMIASLLLFALVLWNDGTVSRLEGLLLVPLALMVWLYRASPVFKRAAEGDDDGGTSESPGPSRVRTLGLLLAGVAAMLAGAELVVEGIRALLVSVRLSETFLGMAVAGTRQSRPSADDGRARMVAVWPCDARARVLHRRLAQPPGHALTRHRRGSRVDRSGVETVVRALVDANIP
jgi:Ca2+/Na+ antiporter